MTQPRLLCDELAVRTPGRPPGRHPVRHPDTPGGQRTIVALWSLLPLLLLGCLLTHQGKLLNYAFPALSLVVALVMARSSPRDYVRLMVFAFIFTPMVRRLADFFGAGFTDPSPILLTAYLVPMAGLRCLRLRELAERKFLPFNLALLGIGYGFLVGLANVPEKAGVLVACLRWTAPLVGGLYLVQRQQENQTSLVGTYLQTFRWAALIAAAYGLVQIVITPPWDMFWLRTMVETGAGNSYGRPVAFGFRAFGPLNSAGIAAEAWGFGFLLWLFDKSTWRPLALAVLAAAIFLTLVRTEWLCLPIAIALGLIVSRVNIRYTLTGLAATFAVLLVAAAATAAVQPDLANSVTDRVQTMGDSGKDESLESRKMAMRLGVTMIEGLPFGKGLGFLDSKEYSRTPMANPSNATGADLGLLGMLFDLGYLGSALYLSGVIVLCLFAWRLQETHCSSAPAVKAAILLTLLHVWSNNPFAAPTAMIVWALAAVTSLGTDSIIATADARFVATPPLAPAESPFSGSLTPPRRVPQ